MGRKKFEFFIEPWRPVARKNSLECCGVLARSSRLLKLAFNTNIEYSEC
jgi:hypothetical protein